MFLSVVIPILNEQETLPELYNQLTKILKTTVGSYEIIFVNDGSQDKSLEIMMNFNKRDSKVKIIELSRNFGHQAAISAGIDCVSGDAVILMDGDLQDPPEFLPQLISKWKEGFKVVYAIRRKRKERFLKRLAFNAFYRILHRISYIKQPIDAGIFSIIDREVINVLNSMPERNKYITGLRAWSGFLQTGIECERGSRYTTKTRVSLSKLFKLAFDGIFAFSYIPLRISIVIGLLSSIVAFIIALFALYGKLFTGKAIAGWASTIISITFLGGVTLLILGIIGEYIARIYDEVKARPYYIISKKMGFDSEE